MMQLSASCSVLTESQRIHSGKEKLNLLLAGHLSYLEVQNPRGTKEQSDESEDWKEWSGNLHLSDHSVVSTLALQCKLWFLLLFSGATRSLLGRGAQGKHKRYMKCSLSWAVMVRLWNLCERLCGHERSTSFHQLFCGYTDSSLIYVWGSKDVTQVLATFLEPCSLWRLAWCVIKMPRRGGIAEWEEEEAAGRHWEGEPSRL